MSVHNGSVVVAGIKVLDLPTEDVVDLLARDHEKQTVAFALHIGGLNVRRNSSFMRAMHRADLVYADGKSIEWLAKIGGANSIKRAATTDIGLPVIWNLSRVLRRPVKVALVGGPIGLAHAAGEVIEAGGFAKTVFTHVGYDLVDSVVCRELRTASPDIVFVGLGMPYEAIWVDKNREQLPACLIMTVGGWFGFLTGQESRAPQALQAAGLEWVYRMFASRGRLTRRYITGIRTFANVASEQIWGARGNN